MSRCGGGSAGGLQEGERGTHFIVALDSTGWIKAHGLSNRIARLDPRALDGWPGQEIGRLGMGLQQSLHAAAQLGVAATGLIEITGSFRRGVPVQRFEEDGLPWQIS